MRTAATVDEALLEDMIQRLLVGGRTRKQVKLSESEIRLLCVEGKKTFLSQPNLLKLKTPIKICGNFSLSFPIFFPRRLFFLIQFVSEKIEFLFTVCEF